MATGAVRLGLERFRRWDAENIAGSQRQGFGRALAWQGGRRFHHKAVRRGWAFSVRHVRIYD